MGSIQKVRIVPSRTGGKIRSSRRHIGGKNTAKLGGISKRVPSGRIIRRIKVGLRVYELHATKGWRSYRAA